MIFLVLSMDSIISSLLKLFPRLDGSRFQIGANFAVCIHYIFTPLNCTNCASDPWVDALTNFNSTDVNFVAGAKAVTA
jgi:predicted choloylglycine hydrolase